LRRLAIITFLVLTSIVLTATLLEFGLRLFYPQGGPPAMYQFDPHLGHTNIPNLDFTHIWAGHEGVARIRTGPMGFRDSDVSTVKKPNEFRILLLGDSYTFGYGVDGGSTFAKILERNLNSMLDTSKRFLVINAGVTGYGTAQEMLQYEIVGSKLNPDLVLLGFFVGNDVQDNLCLLLKTLTPHRRAPCFVVEEHGLALKSVPLQTTNDGSKETPLLSLSQAAETELYELIYLRARRFLVGTPWLVRFLYGTGIEVHPGYLPHVVAGWYLPENVESGFPLTQRLLRRLHEDVTKTGARLAVVLIPSRVQVLPKLFELSKTLYRDVAAVDAFFQNPNKPQQMLLNFLGQEGIPALDLLPLLGNYPDVDELYLPINAHWNGSGHRLAGQAIQEFLRLKRMIPQLQD